LLPAKTNDELASWSEVATAYEALNENVSLPAHGKTGRVSPSHYPLTPVTQFQL